mmetsp:Transcript_10357/g.9985  ORF Transcript_10357/g.9985 Transcript_10357/m.9985 type:complete len:253 (+) Transcript_10357:318-1076(+)
MPIFEQLHPNCELHYGFDHSQNHKARKPDALWAKNLNQSDGGKKVKNLRDTTWKGSDGEIHTQKMQGADGKQKGIKTILIERGARVPGMVLDCTECQDPLFIGPRAPNCCSRSALASHEDFQQSEPWLQEIAEDRGHQIFFFPKFHCELNFIEMIWAYLKAHLRKICTFSFKDLQNTLPTAIKSVPIPFMKKASRHCFRFMSAYREGLSAGPLIDFAMKKYSGHRRLPSNVLGEITEEYKTKKALADQKNRF